MFHKFFIASLSLLLSLPALCQLPMTDSSASCVAYWKKGATKTLYINHNKTTGGHQDVDFFYEAAVTVLDSTATGYTLQWIFHLPESVKQAKPGLADSLPVFEGLKMIYTTTGTGMFTTLSNWETVRDAYVKMMEYSLPKKLDSTAIAAIEKAKAMYGTREIVESALIREIQLYHFPFGYEFSTQQVSANTQLPNPFSATPIPAVQTIQIKAINQKAGDFKLAITLAIDKSAARTVFEAIVNKMGMDKDKVVAEAKQMLDSFEITDYSEYLITPSTGWIKRIDYKRTVNYAGKTQTDSYTIGIKE